MGVYQLSAILGFSSVFAAALGLIRYSKIEPAYRPLIYIICLGFFNHSLSQVLIQLYRTNTANGNFFVLAESLLYVWLFGNWGLFKRRPWMRYVLYIVLPLVWIGDNLVWHDLKTANAAFRIFSSFVMIFLAIEEATGLITKVKTSLLRNAIFITCCCMLIYFSYKAFIEVFFLIQTPERNYDLLGRIYKIFIYVNCFVNLLFVWDVLCIPTKKQPLLSP